MIATIDRLLVAVCASLILLLSFGQSGQAADADHETHGGSCSPCEDTGWPYAHFFSLACCEGGMDCYNATLHHTGMKSGKCRGNHDRCGLVE